MRPTHQLVLGVQRKMLAHSQHGLLHGDLNGRLNRRRVAVAHQLSGQLAHELLCVMKACLVTLPLEIGQQLNPLCLAPILLRVRAASRVIFFFDCRRGLGSWRRGRALTHGLHSLGDLRPEHQSQSTQANEDRGQVYVLHRRNNPLLRELYDLLPGHVGQLPDDRLDELAVGHFPLGQLLDELAVGHLPSGQLLLAFGRSW